MRTHNHLAKLAMAFGVVLGACSNHGESHEVAPAPDTEAVSVGTSAQALSGATVVANRCGDSSGLQSGAAWPMAGGCGTHAAVAAVYGGTQSVRNWRADLAGKVESSPVVGVDGTIYVGSNTVRLSAISPDTGRLLWDVMVGGVVRGAPAIGKDGTIYVATESSGLHAIDPTSRLEKWVVDPTSSIVGSPAIAPDGTIYVGNAAGQLVAVGANGLVKWRFTAGGAIESSPAINLDGTVFFGANDNSVYALSATGTQKWKKSVGNKVRSSPAVANGVVYVGSDANKLHALSASNGAVVWEKAIPLSGGRSSPAIGPGGHVFIGGTDSKVYAFSPAGGLVWTYATGGAVNSTPVIDLAGRLYVGSDDRKLHAVNTETGLRVFAHDVNAALLSPTLDRDGRVIVGSADGSFYSVAKGSRSDRFDIDPTVTPADATTSDDFTGEALTISSVVNDNGDASNFITNQILLAAMDAATLNAFTARYGGALIETTDMGTDPTDPEDFRFAYNVRLDLSRAPDPTTIPANLARIDPDNALDPQSFRVSGVDALAAVSIWADATANGFRVELNSVFEEDSIATGSTIDGANSPDGRDWVAGSPSVGSPTWTPNAFDWVSLARLGVATIDVPGAWTALLQAGRLQRTVRAAVEESYFAKADPATNNDLPANAQVFFGKSGPLVDPYANGSDRHGLRAALVGYGAVDNGRGGAGVGEPVVKELYLQAHNEGSFYRTTKNINFLASKVDVLSMSHSAEVHTKLSGPVLKGAIKKAHNKGVIVISSAGNKGKNVDRETGLMDREIIWHLPCEAPKVLCVGGLDFDSLRSTTDTFPLNEQRSNYGDKDVDIWAPWFSVIGQVPGGGDTSVFTGTSSATPFVAGVAALVKAANPALKPDEIQTILRTTVRESPDGFVKSGIVQARAAVVEALRRSTTPSLRITTPENNATFPYGMTPPGIVGFSGGTPTVDWFVNGSKATTGIQVGITNTFLNPGSNTVEARGRFPNGTEVSNTITITQQLPGSLKILLPVGSQALRPEEPNLRLLSDPLGQTEWFEDGQGPFVRGGDLTLRLPISTPGQHEIMARLTNGTTTLTDKRTVIVLPAGMPKTTLTMVTPPVGAVPDAGSPISFSATALDGSGPTSGSIVWIVTDAATGLVKTIQNGPSGTVSLPMGRFIFTVVVIKSVDLSGDGVPETSATVASEVRVFNVLGTPPT